MHEVLVLGNADYVVSLIEYDDAITKLWLKVHVLEQQWVQKVLVAHDHEFCVLAELRFDGVGTEFLAGGHTLDFMSG